MYSGYEKALEAAGAKIEVIEYFGSYQGDVWAKVKYRNITGWITFAYGSCSGCDAYEGTFLTEDPTKEELAEFGKEYLDNILSQEEAEKKANENSSWDCESEKMVRWIKKNAIEK